jgi:hypothetical protein
VAVTLNSWSHVSLVRTSGVLKIFVNGVQGYSASYGTNLDRTAGLVIGDTIHAAAPMLGYISNLRIVKGTAVYTTTFTPSTTPLTAIANTSLLTLQYNGGANNQGIIDNSNFNNIITRSGNTSQGTFSPYSVTGWSNYFVTSGNYFSTPATHNAFAASSENFTIECWIYLTGVQGMVCGWGNTNFDYLQVTTSGFDINMNNTYNVGASFSFSLNTWYHIAISRVSNVNYCFGNGTLIGSGITNNQSFGSGTTALRIGDWVTTPRYPFPGYISNFRFVKGTGLYSSSFTPSTTPLTAVANTQLLTCQSNRFIDNSPNNFALTVTGTPTIQAYSPFGSIPEATPISYSNYFDGTGDYLQLSDNVAFDLGTNNFTIEFWFMRTATPTVTYHGLVGGNGSGFYAWSLYYTNGNEIMIINSAGTIQTTTGASIANNTWYHVAVVKNTGILKIFVNGVERYSAADVAAYNITANGWRIGDDGGHANGWMNGYISNLRVVKGTAVYTSAFTPSTTPLTAIANTSILTCQSTTMIDNSTNAFAITANGNTVPRIFNPFGYTAQVATSYTPSTHGGSAYFDGSGDYLTTLASATYLMTGQDFTVECWAYPTSIPAQAGLVGINNTASSGGANFGIYLETNRNITFWVAGNATTYSSTNTPITISAWNHIAFVRSGSTNTVYVNGVSVLTNAATPSWSGTPVITVGRLFGDNVGVNFYGYISNVRIIKGTAVYTSSFIPPTQALTSLTTTPATLLLNFNNGGIVDQHSTNVLETVGNAQLSTSVKKYNNSSMYFDGTGDYLTFAPTQATAFGTGDFTIEFWVYPITKVGSYPGLFGNQSFTANSFVGYERHSGYPTQFSVYCYNYAASAMLVSTTTVSINTWYHIAITRSGNNFRLFVNGTVSTSI